MNRLLLVSNRLPVTVTRRPDGLAVAGSTGGLVSGLRKLHARAECSWIGWAGVCDAGGTSDRAELERQLAPLRAIPVHLSSEEARRYYGDFSNGVLWPLFHYATGVLPLEIEGWEEYCAVNESFADTVVAHYKPGDVIWIHDYQLLLLPGLLRRRLPDAKIGFFLHIPFPASDLFGTIPNRKHLLAGLLGADLVGFHTESYQRHFESAVEQFLDIPKVDGALHFQGRAVRTGAFPIGVDVPDHAARADQATIRERVQAIRGDRSIALLVGIDRLDYTKGIARRLLALRELLTKRPEWLGHMRLIQIAVPTRGDVAAYQKIRHEVENLVGQINGTFGTTDWTPVQYMCRSINCEEVTALYCAADVMLVTPVRDGMNLVAKEFVASRTDGDGVLVLSEFAGAAAELVDAVLVNPYDISGSADAYHRAMTMPRPERRARMEALRRSITRYDVTRWTDSFLHELTQPVGQSRGERFRQLASALIRLTGKAGKPESLERPRRRLVLNPLAARGRSGSEARNNLSGKQSGGVVTPSPQFDPKPAISSALVG